jgi:hypothetical protein
MAGSRAAATSGCIHVSRLAGFNRYPDIGQYLAANELSDNFMKLPDDKEDLNALIRLMPDGWMYIAGLWDFEHIGQQCFYVLQHFRPAEFGSEAEWNELRFGRQYVPETDREESLVDVLGPYPSKGHYELPVVRVCEIETYEDAHPVEIGKTITREICRYKDPTIENTVEPLREMLKIRDRLSKVKRVRSIARPPNSKISGTGLPSDVRRRTEFPRTLR